MPASVPDPRADVAAASGSHAPAERGAPRGGGAWVLLAATVSYLGAFGNAFVRDDLPLIRDDARLASWTGLWQCFTGDYWGDFADAGLYRPLTQASYALNRALAATGPDGPSTFGFTLGNLALHAAVAWLVWRLAGLAGWVGWLAGWRLAGWQLAGWLMAGWLAACRPKIKEYQ